MCLDRRCVLILFLGGAEDMCLDREMCSDIIPWWGRGDVFRTGDVF